MSGTCKKTYQGHVNKKYGIGGAFGVSGSEAFIVSGSENGEILFWDIKSKELVQTVRGHDGVVIWVDTCPGPSGTLVSGGLDGTVRIWVDVSEDDDIHANGLTLPEDGATPLDQGDESDTAQLKAENAKYNGDIEGDRMSTDGDESPRLKREESSGGQEAGAMQT